jgi:hypothetical protein
LWQDEKRPTTQSTGKSKLRRRIHPIEVAKLAIEYVRDRAVTEASVCARSARHSFATLQATIFSVTSSKATGHHKTYIGLENI